MPPRRSGTHAPDHQARGADRAGHSDAAQRDADPRAGKGQEGRGTAERRKEASLPRCQARAEDRAGHPNAAQRDTGKRPVEGNPEDFGSAPGKADAQLPDRQAGGADRAQDRPPTTTRPSFATRGAERAGLAPQAYARATREAGFRLVKLEERIAPASRPSTTRPWFAIGRGIRPRQPDTRALPPMSRTAERRRACLEPAGAACALAELPRRLAAGDATGGRVAAAAGAGCAARPTAATISPSRPC